MNTNYAHIIIILFIKILNRRNIKNKDIQSLKLFYQINLTAYSPSKFPI